MSMNNTTELTATSFNYNQFGILKDFGGLGVSFSCFFSFSFFIFIHVSFLDKIIYVMHLQT